MKKVRIILSTAACMVAIGGAFAFANPFVAQKTYRVDPITGNPILPLTEAGPHTCLTSSQWCDITYQVDSQGNPIGQGTKKAGTYSGL